MVVIKVLAKLPVRGVEVPLTEHVMAVAAKVKETEPGHELVTVVL